MLSLFKHIHELDLQNELIQSHCIIHKQNLIGKAWGVKQAMSDVSTINFIVWCGLNHRQFKYFLDEIESEYSDTVFYWEVYCFNKDKVLHSFLSPLEEHKVSIIAGHQIVVKIQVGYVTWPRDICGYLNDVNSQLQGKFRFVSEVCNNVPAFLISFIAFE